MTRINLFEDHFSTTNRVLAENDSFKVEIFKFPSGIAAIKISQSRGEWVILPYYGMMIWDAIVDGIQLKMKNSFSQPLPGDVVTDTYGMFQFTSGLLANGTPGPDDNYPIHGEFPTTNLENSYIEIDEDEVTISGEKEYVKGFGDHYFANPSVTIYKNSGLFDIKMSVTNLSVGQKMPLQYMNHMNYGYFEGAKLTTDISEKIFNLRTSIPDHVHPTEKWQVYMNQLEKSGEVVTELIGEENFDPEIVFITENLKNVTEKIKFSMHLKDSDKTIITTFNTSELPYATRWLLYNEDQQVAAFALPATSSPEGFTKADAAGDVIYLEPSESRSFTTTTGIEG